MPKNDSKYGAHPRDRRMCDNMEDRARNRVIDKLHPGPAPDFAFPTPKPETKPERLARLERALVDHACASANPSELAIQIIVLRAEMYG